MPIHVCVLGGEDTCAVVEALEASVYARLQVLQAWPVSDTAPRRPPSSRGSRPGTPLSGGHLSDTASPPASPESSLQRVDDGHDVLGAAVTVLLATLTALVKLGARCPAVLPRVHALVRAARQLAGAPHAHLVVQRGEELEAVLADSMSLYKGAEQQNMLMVPPLAALLLSH